jgi:hypothetical protein
MISSKSTNDEVAFKSFGDENIFFPGTLISLCINSLWKSKSLNESSIKPELLLQNIKTE